MNKLMRFLKKPCNNCGLSQRSFRHIPIGNEVGVCWLEVVPGVADRSDEYKRELGSIGWMGWDYYVDNISHHLPLPKWMSNNICNWFDRRLGITQEEIDFSKRLGEELKKREYNE